MVKKRRFSLEMKDGVEVRTLEELQDNFSLEKVLFYISNGKMQTWLRKRDYNDIADSIEQLDSSDPEYNKNICGIFGVEYDESELEDLEKAKERNRKLELLKQFTDNQEILDNAYFAAFEQDDIYDLLDEGANTIYLCGERFSIPLTVSGVTYIGVNNPVAVISSKTVIDWNEKNISISGVRFDDKYQTLFRTKENNEKAELEARIRAEEEARIRVEMESMRQTERGSYNTESKTIKKEVDVGRYVLSLKDMILGPQEKILTKILRQIQ